MQWLLILRKNMTLMDCIPDDSPAFEDVQADRELLDRLIARLKEIDPDADSNRRLLSFPAEHKDRL